MGRKAFGVENVFRILSEGVAKSLNNGLQSPVDYLRGSTGLHNVTIRKYLTQLSDTGYVCLQFGGHRGEEIIYLKLLKNEFPEGNGREAAVSALVSRQEEPAEKQSSKFVSVPLVPQQSLVAALVDFDNTEITAKNNGFDVSFAKLRDYLRKFGQVIFADVFLSPFATRPETISRLWDAGFTVIACPQGWKDKDAVDEKMRLRAGDYLREMNIGKIIIVSRDQDFRELGNRAANLHKETVFVDIVAIQEAVRGHDIVPELKLTPTGERFSRIVDCLANNGPVMAAEEERKRFVKDIILAILRRERDSSKQDSFKPLCDYVMAELQQRWHRAFSPDNYKEAMTVLVQRQVLIKYDGGRMNYYKLDTKNSAVLAVLGAKKPK